MTHSEDFCELCRAETQPAIGCACVPRLKRMEILLKLISEVKQHAVSDQRFHVAEMLRDSCDKLVVAMYCEEHTEYRK